MQTSFSSFFGRGRTGLFALLLLVFFSSSSVAATYHVDLQPIFVCDDAGALCATSNYTESGINSIWSQADLQFNFLPATQLLNSQFLNLDFTDLHETALLFGRNLGTGTPIDPLANGAQPSPILNLWIVLDSTGGVTSSLIGDNKAWVRGIFAGETDLIFSHVLGHTLGLTHVDASDTTNLMHPTRPLSGLLTAEQIATVQNSSLVSTVPVPAAVWLFGTALIGLIGFGKRKARIAA